MTKQKLDILKSIKYINPHILQNIREVANADVDNKSCLQVVLLSSIKLWLFMK